MVCLIGNVRNLRSSATVIVVWLIILLSVMNCLKENLIYPLPKDWILTKQFPVQMEVEAHDYNIADDSTKETTECQTFEKIE